MKTYLFEFIEKKCEEAGFFVSQLSDKADISDSVIQDLRNGRTRLKPGTKQKLAAALKCSIGDIQDAIRRSDEILENGEVLKKHIPEEPVEIPEPEPQCPYDDPVEEPAAEPEAPVFEVTLPEISFLDREIPEKVDPKPYLPPRIEVPVNKVNDTVNHPAHYTQGGIECIDALKASMSRDEYRGYLKGCQMKYMWRYRLKNGIEDLKKARWYLDRLISEMEELPDE